MRVAQKFAGYSLAEADNLRKACGKKIRELIAAEREKFVDGLRAHRATARELGTQLFDIIEPFADYAFNKSHAYGYGLVAYQTAYLKAHHPVEYLAALLTSVKGNQEKAAVYLAECRPMGITVLVPDVNLSAVRLRRPRRRRRRPARQPGVDPLRALGGAQRGRGAGRAASSPSARPTAPFTDFYDFCDRVDPAVLNKRTIESLIKAGAFDSLGHPRQGLLRGVRADHRPHPRPPARAATPGVMSLFGDLGGRRRRAGVRRARRRSPTSSSTRRQRLAFEKEMLGLYVSDHPLHGRRGGAAPPHRLHASPTSPSARTATWSTVGGVVTGAAAQVHQAGRPDGRVHPRGPPVGRRGDGLPQDDDRARPQAAPTTPSSSSRAGSTPGRTRPS